MINLPIDSKTFLNEYWQKKPLLIPKALPNFINPLSGDELAGLALEEAIESRLVFETPGVAPAWQLKTGPFFEADFEKLPKTHWTLLVQGVDRVVPEVAKLLDHFDNIPQWRFDDVMISYAVKYGSVGPHYDNYDVFLYQAEGQRKWSLTTKDCNPENYLTGVPLRIMGTFKVEEEYLLEPGDMLYLPPHVGHHGVSQSDACMTYSFGYRSYQGQELWDSFGDYLSEHLKTPLLYKDPLWQANQPPSRIPPEAWLKAKQLMQQFLEDEEQLKRWFGCFVTSLDAQAEPQLSMPLAEDEAGSLSNFMDELMESEGLLRDSACRFAYQEPEYQFFINGCVWPCEGVSPELLKCLANNRFIDCEVLRPWLSLEANQLALFELWKLQWVQLQ